jgi:hypothetical protein
MTTAPAAGATKLYHMEFCTARSSLHQELTQEFAPAAAGGTTSSASAVASVLSPSAGTPLSSMEIALQGVSLDGCANDSDAISRKIRVESAFIIVGYESESKENEFEGFSFSESNSLMCL